MADGRPRAWAVALPAADGGRAAGGRPLSTRANKRVAAASDLAHDRVVASPLHNGALRRRPAMRTLALLVVASFAFASQSFIAGIAGIAAAQEAPITDDV